MTRQLIIAAFVSVLGLAGCQNIGDFGKVMEQNPEITGAVAGALVCGAATGDLAPTAICAALGAGGGYLYRRQSEGRTVEGCRGDDVPVSKKEPDGQYKTYCVPKREVEKYGTVPRK